MYKGSVIKMKKFNTAGTCFPDIHYMADITDKVQKTAKMVEEGSYFCINRGRQYGKTTLLYGLKQYLQSEYMVFSITFEGLSDEDFENANAFYRTFFSCMKGVARNPKNNITKPVLEILGNAIKQEKLDARISKDIIYDICYGADKPIVIIIDEVDQAGNYEMFVKFLGMLRAMYLQRQDSKAFHSVIFDGVYDIKNLKLKLRSESEHQYNSPWNIAVNYDVDMSLSSKGIAGMLTEYMDDHHIEIDVNFMADLLREYTAGYPFLVSRLCQIIDEKNITWDKEGFLQAVNILLNEHNTIVDDIAKKLEAFPMLKEMLKEILYSGKKQSYNIIVKEIDLAYRFGYIYNNDGYVAVTNRIFETLLYNFFIAEDSLREVLHTEGSIDKKSFIKNGSLDMRHVLERFVVHYNEIYSSKDAKFLENTGRKLFLLYLRPIINGVGHYYIEAQTRDETRTDIIVDYLGKRYIIELKIWHGRAYNEAGRQQLAEYLELMGEDEGYLLSFSFNKNKNVGVKEENCLGKKIVEVLV